MRHRAGFGILCLTALLLPAVASAHTYKTDGTITALLHLQPNDEPVAGQGAGLTFTFIDPNHTFSAKTCACRILIKAGSHILMDRPITRMEVRSDQEIWVDYTFPYQATYDVKLQGAPQLADEFQAFTLDYDAVRVDHGALRTPASPAMIWGLSGFGALAILAAGFFIYRELRQDGGGNRDTI